MSVFGLEYFSPVHAAIELESVLQNQPYSLENVRKVSAFLLNEADVIRKNSRFSFGRGELLMNLNFRYYGIDREKAMKSEMSFAEFADGLEMIGKELENPRELSREGIEDMQDFCCHLSNLFTKYKTFSPIRNSLAA